MIPMLLTKVYPFHFLLLLRAPVPQSCSSKSMSSHQFRQYHVPSGLSLIVAEVFKSHLKTRRRHSRCHKISFILTLRMISLNSVMMLKRFQLEQVLILFLCQIRFQKVLLSIPHLSLRFQRVGQTRRSLLPTIEFQRLRRAVHLIQSQRKWTALRQRRRRKHRPKGRRKELSLNGRIIVTSLNLGWT